MSEQQQLNALAAKLGMRLSSGRDPSSGSPSQRTGAVAARPDIRRVGRSQTQRRVSLDVLVQGDRDTEFVSAEMLQERIRQAIPPLDRTIARAGSISDAAVAAGYWEAKEGHRKPMAAVRKEFAERAEALQHQQASEFEALRRAFLLRLRSLQADFVERVKIEHAKFADNVDRKGHEVGGKQSSRVRRLTVALVSTGRGASVRAPHRPCCGAVSTSEASGRKWTQR